MVKNVLIFVACLFSVTTSHAQSKKIVKKPPLPKGVVSNKTVVLTYSNLDWNRDSLQIDSARVLFRDKKTNHITQVFLEETAPDSGIFTGIFGINWASATGELDPEVLVPPQDLFEDPEGHKELQTQLEKNEIPSLPVFFYEEGGQQRVDVFLSSEEVENARKRYLERQDTPTVVPSQRPKDIRDKLAESVFEADQLAKIEKEKKIQAQESEKREKLREKLLEEEKLKLEKQRAEMRVLAEKEKAKRIAEALLLSNEAMKLYGAGKFKEAEVKFAKSVALNPDNKKIYYAYGIALFRNQKFNESIVKLENSDVDKATELERDFYLGLNHYRLKEYSKALGIFDKIRKTKEKTLGPSAAFYMGMIEFDQTHYEAAKPFFQEVLDTSSEPKLDEQAEFYIEKIEQMLMFARNKAKKFIATLSVGTQYDSNILLISNGQLEQNPPSDVGGTRIVGSGGLMWRPIYNKSYEFGVKAKVDTLYTLQGSLAQADPIIYNLSAPFTYKHTLFGKGYKLEAKPYYEMLYYDANTDGTKESYLNSVGLDLSNLFVMNEAWFSGYNLKYRNDTGVTDATVSATKLTFDLNNIYFLNKKRTQGLIGDIAYSMNNSNGTAYKYQRYDLSALYLTSVFTNYQFMGGLSYYAATYPDLNPVRSDTDITVLTNLTRPLTSWLTLTANINYVVNNSNTDAYNYKKYIVGLTANAEYQF